MKKKFLQRFCQSHLYLQVQFSVLALIVWEWNTRLLIYSRQGNSISVNRVTNTPKLSGKFPDGSEIKNGYNSASWTQIEAKWDYNGTTLGLSTGSPYSPHTILYNDGALTNAGAKVSSNETAILASRGLGNGMKVFGGIRLTFKVRTDRPFTTSKHYLSVARLHI